MTDGDNFFRLVLSWMTPDWVVRSGAQTDHFLSYNLTKDGATAEQLEKPCVDWPAGGIRDEGHYNVFEMHGLHVVLIPRSLRQ